MDIRTQRLLERTFDFGVNIMKFLKKLPDDFIYRIPKESCRNFMMKININKILKYL